MYVTSVTSACPCAKRVPKRVPNASVAWWLPSQRLGAYSWSQLRFLRCRELFERSYSIRRSAFFFFFFLCSLCVAQQLTWLASRYDYDVQGMDLTLGGESEFGENAEPGEMLNAHPITGSVGLGFDSLLSDCVPEGLSASSSSIIICTTRLRRVWYTSSPWPKSYVIILLSKWN